MKSLRSKKESVWLRILSALLVLTFLDWTSCSTTEIMPGRLPDPPSYTRVAHPSGNDISDISAVLMDPMAPKEPNFPETCDSNFKKLNMATQSFDEIREGTKELVRSNPVHYHWCFYSVMYKLEGDLKKEGYVDERQKLVLNRFEFLTPIARAFNTEFQDSRYLRSAVYRYQKLSEWVFFRRVELNKEGTAELVQPMNPFGLWRRSEGGYSILDRYHISTDGPAFSSEGSMNQDSLNAPASLAPTMPSIPVSPP